MSQSPITLFHVTTSDLVESIVINGVNAPSYWTSDEDVAEYYADNFRDEGLVPVTISTFLHLLDESTLLPDMPSIAEPITTALGKSEGEVSEEWADAENGDWQDSLRIVMSLKVSVVIPAECLSLAQ